MAAGFFLVEVLFLALGAAALAFGLISLADGVRFRRRVTQSLGVRPGFAPRAAVLVPVRGIDPTLDRTLEALTSQRYEPYRLLFLVDPGDEAEAWLRDRELPPEAEVVPSEPRGSCSGKIAALLAGLDRLRPGEEVVVFADSDIVPDRDWLAHLVAPLQDPGVTAATGYRWYFPRNGGWGPALQAAWNGAAANVMFHPRWSYLWGGSTAIRRETLEEVEIRALWQDVLSDDMVLTQALKARGRRTAFVPRATVATYTDASLAEAVAWTHRQACLALLYHPAMRRLTLPYALYAGSVLLAVVAGALAPLSPLLPWAALLLLSPAYLGLAKSALRRGAFRRAMPSFRSDFRRGRLRFSLAALLLPFLMLVNVRRAARMRAFRWRGRTYRFRGPRDITVADED